MIEKPRDYIKMCGLCLLVPVTDRTRLAIDRNGRRDATTPFSQTATANSFLVYA